MSNTILNAPQGIGFFTETKTVTSLWRSDDASDGKISTAMPTPK